MRFFVVFFSLLCASSVFAEDLERMAKRGDISAQFELGRRCFEEKDCGCAARWLGAAAWSNDKRHVQTIARAQNMLGVLRANGCDGKPDPHGAMEMFRKAADAGNTTAMVNLGLMLEKKEGLQLSDMKLIAGLYKKAALQGSTEGKYFLGNLLDYAGDIRFRNKKHAAQWYEKAGNDGHLNAQFRLGMMFRDGVGIPQDYAKSREWLGKAAAGGHLDAQHYLGLMHRDGIGTPKDAIKGRELLKRACKGGYEPSCKGLED